MARVNVAALNKIIAQCERFRKPDVRPLLTSWERRIVADNKRGILAGKDKDGIDFKAVTYRPKGEPARHRPKRQTRAQRESSGNNLSSAEYRKLAGPPLAPRGARSRIITNLYTEQGYDSLKRVYYAVGAWAGVVSKKGVEFLLAHFDGARCGKGHRVKLPVRDARGIRPEGRAECLDDLAKWGDNHAKATFI